MGDNLTFYNNLIMIKLVILSIVACFSGLGGMLITITLTVVFMLWVCAQFIGFDKGAIIVIPALTGMLLYLAFGILLFKDFIVNNDPLTFSFYIWAMIIFTPMVVINIGNYLKNPLRFYYFKTRKFAKKHKKEQAEYLKVYNNYRSQLNVQFEKSIADSNAHEGYITLSEKVANHLQGYLPLTNLLATFTAKLIIKTCAEGDLETAQIYLDSYIDAIIPNTGLSDKSSDVASNGIVLSIRLSNDDIYHRIEKHILGGNVELSKITNEILLFNLACHYSLKHDKESLLIATEYALQKGMPADKFLTDCDFKYYFNDKDFLAIVNEGLKPKGAL